MVPADEGVNASSREDGHSRTTGYGRHMEARCEGRAKDRRGDDLEQA